MKRYFFDVRDSEDHPDTHGSLWSDDEAAKVEAVRCTGEILREMPERLLNSLEWKMTVRDRSGRRAFALSISLQA